jgi:L-lactate dehydrogenase
MLDTARFRQIMAAAIGVDVTHVHAYVVGEHGDSEVLVWSSLDIAGQSPAEFASAMGGAFTDEDRRRVEDEVVHAADAIIRGKGATYFGVAAVIARAVEVILRDRRSILTVSATSSRLRLRALVATAGERFRIVRELGEISIDEDEQRRLGVRSGHSGEHLLIV